MIGAAERDQYLVQHNIVQNLETGCAQAFCEAFCVAAIALDQFAQAPSAK
jgi:hypothetical protein